MDRKLPSEFKGLDVDGMGHHVDIIYYVELDLGPYSTQITGLVLQHGL